jgi:hypothetical protein
MELAGGGAARVGGGLVKSRRGLTPSFVCQLTEPCRHDFDGGRARLRGLRRVRHGYDFEF